MLKSQIPIRTWAQWDDAAPGFVEIDLVGHEGSNHSGQYCFTLTVTDIATGWTVNRSVPNRAQKHVFAALQHVLSVFPFPVIGIDSDYVGFQINLDGTGVQGTPAPAALALVISGATASADPAAVTHRTRRPDRGDQDTGFLIEIDGLHDRFLDTKQRSP